MFYNCISLNTLDLSNFNTSKVTDMRDMFSNCYRLVKIKLGENFSFNGAKTTRQTSLSNPDKTYISTTSGKWNNIETGESYLGTEVPNNVAATYYAYIDTTWEYEAKKCINAYKQVVGLNEVKVADICPGISNLYFNNFNNDIYFSFMGPGDTDGKDGDLWVVIE
jgi:surface protein